MTRVALIEPAYTGYKLIEVGQRIAASVVVVTASCDDRVIPAELLALASEVVVCETNEPEAVIGALRKQGILERLDAVLPGHEYYVPIAARVAEAAGLPHLSTAASLGFRDKLVMRSRLAAANVRVPGFSAFDPRDRDSIEAALQGKSFPCIVKPRDEMGSIGVRALADREAVFAFAARYSTSRKIRFGRQPTHSLLLEDYVTGDEYSVEGCVTAAGVS